MLHFNFNSIHLIVTRGYRVSRAPPHHTLPAFLNLNQFGHKRSRHRLDMGGKTSPRREINIFVNIKVTNNNIIRRVEFERMTSLVLASNLDGVFII